jgi:4-diphosphocytidyl-2C-methyl-D-erythritol kinase
VLLPGESPISTAAVYGRLGLDGSRAETGQGVYDAAAAGLGVPLDRCRNDLEPVVAAHWPDVAERLSALRTGAPLAVMLSGSGGTVFAVHAEESDARAQAETLRARRPLVAPVLSRAQSTLRPLVTEER